MTPETDQLVGTWTRADDAAPVAPPVRSASSAAADASTDPDGDPDGGVDGSAARPGGPTRRNRRVTTQPAPGSDPSPAPEPARHRDGENDAQLLRDVPPHW